MSYTGCANMLDIDKEIVTLLDAAEQKNTLSRFKKKKSMATPFITTAIIVFLLFVYL